MPGTGNNDGTFQKTVLISPGTRTPPPAARLLCEQPSLLAGATGGVVHLVYGEVTVGRGQGNTVIVSGRSVSKKHAQFVPEKTGWLVEDLGSTNGLFVNGSRIAGQVSLNDGDVVAIGEAKFRYELVPARAEVAEGGAVEAGSDARRPAEEADERPAHEQTVYLRRKSPATPQGSTPRPQPRPQPAPPPVAAAPAPAHGKRALWIIGAVAVVLILAAGGYLLLG